MNDGVHPDEPARLVPAHTPRNSDFSFSTEGASVVVRKTDNSSRDELQLTRNKSLWTRQVILCRIEESSR